MATTIPKPTSTLFVISLVDKSLPMEFFFIELSKHDSNFQIVFLNPAPPSIMINLVKKGLSVKWIKYSGKKDVVKVFFKLFLLCRSIKPSVIHAHLFDASLISLPAAMLAKIKKRIYTRHHSSQHHIYSPHAVKYDRFINMCATEIFAISENVKNVLVENENVAVEKVKVVHHGFDFNYFNSVTDNRIFEIKSSYNFENNWPVIGVVSRFTHWKGVHYIIDAFYRIVQKYPDAVLILANAKGDYESEIFNKLRIIPSNNYRLIVFEEDSPALFKSFDVFIHTPIDSHSEAFGQVYIEAMMAKIPSIFTLSGIANEFVINRKNAFVVDYKDSKAIYNSIIDIIDDKILVDKIVKKGYDDVLANFDIKKIVIDSISSYEY